MWLFKLLISMAAAGVATSVLSALLMLASAPSDSPGGALLAEYRTLSVSLVLMAVGGILFALQHGCMWLFYHRHEVRRTRKLRTS